MILNNNIPVKVILTFILLMMVVGLVAEPVISFDFLIHNFGEFKEETGKVSHDFTFTNTGDDTLKLIKVKAS
jgi:uncharacterized protein DUF1573